MISKFPKIFIKWGFMPLEFLPDSQKIEKILGAKNLAESTHKM